MEVTNMKKKIIYCLLVACSVFTLMGCDKNDPNLVDTSTYYHDDFVLQHYAANPDTASSSEYEVSVLGGQSRVPGPTDYKYTGVIYLTEDAALSYIDDYEWVEADNVPFDCSNIDYKYLENDTWYTCSDFTQSYFKGVAVSSLYFNGEDALIFSVSTY